MDPTRRNNRIAAVIAVLYLVAAASGIWLIFTNKPVISAREKTPDQGITLKPRDTIAVVRVAGPIRISQRPGKFLAYDAEGVARDLREFGKKSDVKAVLIRINSPGGSVAAVQEIYSEIMKLRENGKVVVASMGDVAASGGYYIAAACDRIVANPGTLTGSIGVILEVANVQELFRKIGVKMETIKTGRFKDSGSPYRDLTEEERESFQALINDAYKQFLTDIMKGRKMELQKLKKLANGRIFTGSQALDAGLIDKLGSEEDALELAKKLAGITGKPRIIRDGEPWDRLISFFGEQTARSPLGGFTDVVSNMRIRMEYMLE